MTHRFRRSGGHVAAWFVNEQHHNGRAGPQHDGIEIEGSTQRNIARQVAAQRGADYLSYAQGGRIHAKRSAARFGIGQIGHQRLLGGRRGAEADRLGSPKPHNGTNTNWPIEESSKVRLRTMTLDRPLMNRPVATGGRRPTRSDSLPKRDCKKAKTMAEGK